jgi:predicted N-acetyltransferase YhbS
MAGRPESAQTAEQPITIRRAMPADAAVCGAICYEAFQKINSDHGFPPDLPDKELGVNLLSRMFASSTSYCIVAESGGRIVGSNCMDERSAVYGIGPITIDPSEQNHGIGRALMNAVLDRARARRAPGVRLVQSAFHNRTMALYTTLGFDVREPLSVLQGPAIAKTIDGCSVREATNADLAACSEICKYVHGFDRSVELAHAIHLRNATVVERDGKITGYSTGIAFFGYSVAETNRDLQALIAAAPSFGGPGMLAPSRNSELFRWCLEHGLRIVTPMTLMTMGMYSEPKGAYLPSVLF